jgi:Rrf2 family protein
MSHLATLDAAGLASAKEIAVKYGISTALLMNVMKELSAAGFVESARGARGGYRLAQSPRKINMADVVMALEGPVRSAHCMREQSAARDQGVCRIVDRCPIADPVHRLHRKLNDFLKGLTLADVIETG